MRFSMFGLIQYLTRSDILGPAMQQRDARAGPVQFERGDGGGVLRAHHQHVVIVVRMRLLVIVNDLVELFAGDVQHVRNVVVAGGENDLARAILGLAGS